MASTKSRRRVLLLDGHSLAYRAFYALPSDLRTTSGQVTNAVYGFTSMLIKAIADFKTQHVAVAFDRGAPLERLEIRPEYKAQRVSAPDEFRQQVGLIHEVLSSLRVPVFEIENVEADDIIGVLAASAAGQGHEVIIVTADRDFFQIVGPNVKILMNRRGISDTVLYDEAGVRQRFGFGPDRYLEYAALRGDPSDNIEGVAGVGEKTAAKLVIEHGTLEEIFAHLDTLTPKLRANLSEAQQRLLENREFFRLRTMEELGHSELADIDIDQLQMGEWDFTEIRKLFDVLEFRSLYERLVELKPQEAREAEPGFELTSEQVSDIARIRSWIQEADGPVSIALIGDPTRPREAAHAMGVASGSSALWLPLNAVTPHDLISALSEAELITHDSKTAILRLHAVGVAIGDIQFAFDTQIAAYLVDPARGSFDLPDLVRHWLGRELKVDQPPGGGQASLLDETPTDGSAGLEAAAVGALAAELERELDKRGGGDLLDELEIPLARVLAKIETAGVKVDVDYLDQMSHQISMDLRAIEEEIFNLAGGPFNINSPPQLREVLFERLSLKPTKKTKTGFSTDASVLETLRDQHPIIDAILRYRERSKLKSTYIDALPPLVDARTRRIHCRFNQTVAATGRLSSDSPNLQNIPIRTAEGRQIRKAFTAEEGYLLLKADYSQIELRVLAHLSEDPELLGAFERGEDIHSRSIAKALGIELSAVSPELRSIGKMVSYGVTYGMGPFGLSQRLRIPVDQARTYIDGFFSLYPRVREYLDEVVERAAEDGYTTTMLGRRRYLPELKSRNPRMRSLGERMALNAPIQGSAADILKLAMVKADEVLPEPSRIVLTVHDELVFEVPEQEIEGVATVVRRAMEGVMDLRVPLEVDLAAGKDWSDVKKLR